VAAVAVWRENGEAHLLMTAIFCARFFAKASDRVSISCSRAFRAFSISISRACVWAHVWAGTTIQAPGRTTCFRRKGERTARAASVFRPSTMFAAKATALACVRASAASFASFLRR
jgi:hypothetical protein